MEVFGKEWFAQYQDFLLRLFNSKIGRRVLGISVADNKRIIKVFPNGHAIFDRLDFTKNQLLFKWTFFTSPVYAYAVYKKLRWIWEVFHFLDSLILDHQSLIPNFGFEKLTNFKEEDSADTNGGGTVEYYTGDLIGAAWSTVRNSNGNNIEPAYDYRYIRPSIYNGQTTDYWRRNSRGYLSFTTDGLTGISFGNPVSATLKLYSALRGNSGAFWTGTDSDIVLTDANLEDPSSPAMSDYQRIQMTLLSDDRIDFEDLSTGTPILHEFDLNSAGLSHIAVSGETCYSLLFYGDSLNNTPTWINTWPDQGYMFARFYPAFLDPTYQPQLDVTTGIPVQINIGDVWKDVLDIKVNIGDNWKSLDELKINIADVWKYAYDSNPKCNTPDIEPNSKVSTTSVEVTITIDEPSDATIYYTKDNTTPTEESTLYTEPFTCVWGADDGDGDIDFTHVRAIAVRLGFQNSDVAHEVYGWVSPPT